MAARLGQRRIEPPAEQPEADHAGHQQRADAEQQRPAQAVPFEFVLQVGRAPRLGLFGAPLLASPVKRAQPGSQFNGIAEPALRIARGAQRDVLAQQLVVDRLFPAGRQRPSEIADRALIQQDAERVERSVRSVAGWPARTSGAMYSGVPDVLSARLRVIVAACALASVSA